MRSPSPTQLFRHHLLAFLTRFVTGALFVVLASMHATTLMAGDDHLTILSPHRKSIQDEFLPRFRDWYQATYHKSVQIDWLDNGGTADAIRLLRSRYAKNQASSGIDIFWGGGSATFNSLQRDGFLQAGAIGSAEASGVPATAAGVALTDQAHSWYASALSSFGIFFNRKVIKLDGLTAPKTWDDLGDPRYQDQIVLSDPRHSGTAISMDLVILGALGWEKGWALLTKIAANTRTFTHSSSDPVKAVVAGDAAAAMAIDFYAEPKVAEIGKTNLGFILPPGQTVLDPDPIALLKGAPNSEAAKRFVTFVLSAEAQKLWLLPKGAPGGPRLDVLGRMAVNPNAYQQTEGTRVSDFNPFKQPPMFKIDQEWAASLERPLADLIGATHVDAQRELKAAWQTLTKRGLPAAGLAQLTTPPVTSAELLALSKQWNDPLVRNRTVTAWLTAAKAKYRQLETH